MGETQQELGERVGRLADRVDNLVSALALPMPDNLHLRAMREALPDIRSDLRAIVVDLLGENPWEDDDG